MVCFTESWLNETVSDDLLSIDVFAVCTGGTEQMNLKKKEKKGCVVCVVLSKQRNDEIQTMFTGC